MNEPQRLVGTYLFGFEPLVVSTVDRELMVRLGGVPEELAARLVGSGNSYVVKGSQLEGASVDFAEGNPSPGGRLGGVIDFVRSSDPITSSGRGLRLTPMDWETDEEKQYRKLAERILMSGDGQTLEWRLSWPKWRFVEWLSRQRQFTFHGSPLSDVDSFLPRRNSVEIMDQGGKGNRAAVYGTPYGLWAMWFAVIDRDNLTGSIRSGVMRWTDRAGTSTDLYNFSVHHEFVGGEIWRTGTLYLFRQDGFTPIPFYPGGPASNEWASESGLKPLARLAIEPADFPFLDCVGGHDDGELIAAEAAADIVKSRITEARAVPGGMVLSLKWDDEVVRVWDEYLASRLRFNPDVELILSFDDKENATIDVRGPDGYLQAYTASLLKVGRSRRALRTAEEVGGPVCDQPGGYIPTMDTPAARPDLLTLVRAAGIPVPVAIAARALNTTPEQVMALGAELVAEGKLSESPGGYSSVEGSGPALSPAAAAYMAGHLADAMTAEGADRSDIGRLQFAAGRFPAAWQTLAEAGTDLHSNLHDPERLGLLELALRSLSEAKLDGGELEGRVGLHLARLYRSRGESQAAKSSIENALKKLRGEELVDALGFAASVADDLQHPQEAERWVALAELAALQENALAKLGSLLTFHGRELSRLGFASEAEAALGKGNALLLSHGSRQQRFYGRINQAWVDLDQGQMRAAEAGFAHLREEARALEGEASQADKEAYWARALFGTGRPDLALAAIDRAKDMSQSSGALAPRFIAHLALAEGGLLFENWEQAKAGAEGALELALASLPAWENVCRYLLARALNGAGFVDEARAQADLALAASPPGADGIRWRLRIEELQLELSDVWDPRRAEDITDRFLQSRWLGAAVDLMTARAHRDKDREVAAEAASLAIQIGNPVQAAKAIRAGNLWSDPLAAPVLAAVRPLADHFPPDWYPSFLGEPEVATALAGATEVTEEEIALLREKIGQALESAGLSGDSVLSPAQRRTAGLVHRRRPRRLSPLAWVAAAVAMVAIATGTAFAVVNLTAPDPIAAPTTTAPPPTTTTIPPIEAREIPATEDGISGTYAFRGDVGRSGIASGGFREVDGYYWRLEPGGSFVPATSPVACGRLVYVVTDESKIYGYELTGGRLNMVIEADNPITATPAIGQPSGSETVDPLIVFATNDGVVHGYSALRNGTGVWAYPTGSSVRAAAIIVEQSVFVVSTDGHVHAIDLQSGDPLWRYPAEDPEGSDTGEEPPEFNTAPAFSDGLLYVTSREGSLHVIDAITGEPLCERPINLQGSVNSHPVITDGVVLVGLENPPGIHAFAAGTCGTPPTGYSAFYPSSSAVRAGLAATPETVYLLEDRLLLAMLLDQQLWLEVSEAATFPSPWEGGPFAAADIITTPPVIADGVVYVGSQDGMVHAMDAENGEALWSFDAESAIRGELVVVPGAVYVTTAAGEVIAIAGH